MSRTRGLALAAAALGAAVLLALLAVDVLHRESSLAAGDVRYSAGPGQRDLWEASEILPFGSARAVLGLDDDLEYRRALRVYRRSQPRASTLVRVGLAPARAQAEAVVSSAAANEDDPVRKSRLVNLLGVLAVARAAGSSQQSPTILRESVATFREALRIDPSNAEAKANLELVLRVRREQQRVEQESGGRAPRSARVGLGEAGSGY